MSEQRPCPKERRCVFFGETDIYGDSYANAPRGQAWHKTRKWSSCKKNREGWD